MIKNILAKIKRAVTFCDLFCTTELIRYKEEPQFKSASGGLCSLAIILIFSIIFTQTIISTVGRGTITAQTTLYEQIQPNYFNTSHQPFFFALGINGVNLNDPTHNYFDIQASQKIQKIGISKQAIYYKLIPCNRDDWSKVKRELGATFDNLGMANWLCSPPNATFEFQGKFSSNLFKYVKISLKFCSNSSNKTCASSTEIDSLFQINGSLTFNYYFLNEIVNPQSSNLIENYLEDRNYFQFTKKAGMMANIFISSYSIETDVSLLPIQEIVYNEGGLVYEPTQTFIYQPVTDYVQIFLRKSSLSMSIQRSFKKYDDTLSYIGGLFSSIMTAIIFIHKFNEYSYEIQLASKVYKNGEEKIDSQLFNFPVFLGYCIFSALDFIGKAPEWKKMKQFDESRQQIGKQLDIIFILKKLLFLEDCMNYLFEDYQLQSLYLKGKTTLQQAAKYRLRHFSYSKFLKLHKRYGKKQVLRGNTSEDEEIASKKQINQMNIIHIRPRNQKLVDSSQAIKEKQQFKTQWSRKKKNIEQKLKRQIFDEFIQQQEIENYEDSQDLKQGQQQRQFYDNAVRCLKNLQQMANMGNQRCQKIFLNLDSKIQRINSKYSKSQPLIQELSLKKHQSAKDQQNVAEFDQQFVGHKYQCVKKDGF